MKKILIIIGIILLVVVAIAVGFMWEKGLVWAPDSLIKPVPAPPAGGKIKGYWSSEGLMALSELDDAEEMKKIGINTITFSPILSHNQEGKVKELPGNESYIKRTINKAHKAGLRVMLETTPMNAGAVSPKVTNPKLFQDEMTKAALKYAKIANDYNVEFFAPIVEPGHHMSHEESDKWLQELLPKLRAVYDGKIMWKKQRTDLENPKEWNRDHIFNLGFKFENFNIRIQLKSLIEHSISLNINNSQINLEEYSKTGDKFRENKPCPLTPGWHDLKIEIKGNQINIYIDGNKLIEKTDDSGPMGGYILKGPIRVNKLEVSDLEGKPLYQESFENLNSFSAEKGGLTLGDKEIILTPQTEVKLIHDIDFSGYDYIAIDTFHRGKVFTIDEYIEDLEYYIQKTREQAQSDGVPHVIIAEFGGSIKENIGWKDIDERAKIPLTEEELAQTAKRVLEIAEGKVDGYIYNGWDNEGQDINQLPAIKKVIKEWYLSH